MLRQPNNNLQYQPSRPEPRQSAWPGRLFLLLLLVAGGIVFWQRQAISDWIQLYGYTPPSQVATLARQTTMTAPAQHLFYLNKPTIASKATFIGKCATHEQTIVLGCYHGEQNGIYILRIDNNSELRGVMQVTAAHEMLHSAYDRLSSDEKTRIDGLLQNYYDHELKDTAIKAEIDAYRKTEPGELVNEMHSIFGTEIATLPPALEKYYDQYFTNRAAVVSQAQSYQDAFRKRENAVKVYDRQLAALQASISRSEAQLIAEGKALQAARAKLDAYKNSGNISSYNAAVPSYNTSVRAYNSLLAGTKRQIAQYNSLVAKRNALVVEEQDLVKQLSGDNLPAAQ